VFTAGPPPADAQPCDGCGCVDTICVTRCDDTDGDGTANTTYSELWCVHPDGSTALILTYQNDPSTPYTPVSPVDCLMACPESETVMLCDDSGPFLRRYTFLNGQASYEDVALDGQTPHVVTGTIRACGGEVPTCVDTICVTRCDDTDSDGTADTTYTELWCVHDDGSATVILTYRDDPATPYTPVSPVDCTMALPESQTVMLCDDGGPFLRRYTFTGGQAAYEDVALDGQTPHVVTGTVRACGGEECEQPTTPVATIGLCLADGTPIAVVVTRDCQGVITRQGWLNLTTGAYSAGDPPAGTMSCGDSQSIQTSGVFCDVDPATGDVLGLVLIEYTYGADGSIASVRLVDATTGQTYTPQGDITTCPAGTSQPEQDLVILCDIAADGTVTRFVRDFRRDENGMLSGHSDYTLDGAPYQPTGSVSECPTVPDVFHGEFVLCDTAADGTTTQFVRKFIQGADGTVDAVVNLTLDGATYAPQGTVGMCQPDECPIRQVIEVERCDDTTGDGMPDISYVELLGVDCQGTVSSLGTYTCTLDAPYTPVSPVDCCPDVEPRPPVAPGVQARRVELPPGRSWNGLLYGTLRQVTATAHNGTGTVTTTDGTSTLFEDETATWSISKDHDVRLAGPLTITANTGTITVTFTTGVDL
jgi:hypothetical protein